MYECDDPYYDENISMHTSSHSSSRSIVAPQLGNNLMRVVTRDPYEIYDAVKLLGDGSMVRAPLNLRFLICFMWTLEWS